MIGYALAVHASGAAASAVGTGAGAGAGAGSGGATGVPSSRGPERDAEAAERGVGGGRELARRATSSTYPGPM